MDEKVVLKSCLHTSENESDCLYPMFFGVSCAFFGLGLLPEPGINDEKWSEVRNKMLQGSAHLLGLLVWRVQREEANSGKFEIINKLEKAQREIGELKIRRREDAKANEKVVGIFAAQEQSWLSERKKLRQQIGALLNELRVSQTKRDETISKLNGNLQEKERLLQSKDKVLEQEEQKSRELEEKLKEAEDVAVELRETANQEAQRHSSQVWKHKTAFIELISNQRQLEAEMGRALRQVEAAKQELDSVLEQKEESVLMAQKLSLELTKTRKDLEHKERILSAMLRKSKWDLEEKQMLLKEVKLSKDKRKQVELETERSVAVSGSRRERHSLKRMFSKDFGSNLESFSDERGMHSNTLITSQTGRGGPQLTDFEKPEHKKYTEILSELFDQQHSHEGSEELMFAADVKQLKGWVRSETGKYTTSVEQRHHLEINAFAEQLRLKDEKLEAFSWRLLSMELESKRLLSHIEGLDHDLLQLRQENTKLGALLLDQETQLNSFKQQFALQQIEPLGLKRSEISSPPDPPLAHETVWSKVKIVKRKPGEKEHDLKKKPADTSHEVEPQEEETPSTSQCKDTILTVQYAGEEFGEEKDVVSDPGSIGDVHGSPEEVDIIRNSASSGHRSSKSIINSAWRMDLHALGVSYKIKRLNQQIGMLESLTGKRESCEDREGDDNTRIDIRGFQMLVSLLSKQVNRYQSLQVKTDELCHLVHENDLDVSTGCSNIARTKEDIKKLEHFLGETFQLQRYVVASGQKLMEIQSKIASGFIEAAEDLDVSSGFDMKRFADSIRTLFREVQRGLEVRIARMIGDLEGILACVEIYNLKWKMRP